MKEKYFKKSTKNEKKNEREKEREITFCVWKMRERNKILCIKKQ